jgi:pimeloyl-ACP methyl ester carboxylesterase
MLTIFDAKNDPLGFHRRWHELFPDATEYVIEGGHRFPIYDDPGRFAGARRDFASGADMLT